MLIKLTKKIEKWGTIKFLFLFVVLAEILTALLNAVLSIIFWGKISFDLFLIGSIDALIVSLVVSSIGTYLIRKNAELNNEISESKRAEVALRKITELFSLFMHHSPIYTYIKEVTPAESRVLYASENFQQMIGIPGSEMVGKTMNELFPAEFAAKISADDWAVVAGGVVLKTDEDLNGRNYTTIKAPLVQGDKILLVGHTIDITDRKRMELELRQQAAALETNNKELQSALDKVGMLSGMLPICSYCKKIRNDKGYWEGVETYISQHTDTLFSHGICPECEEKALKEFRELKK